MKVKEIEELYPVQWRYIPTEDEIYMSTCHEKRLQKNHIIYRNEIAYCHRQIVGYIGDLIVGGKIESYEKKTTNKL
tara:strand:+ start:815 stop:1042 length:228 start_codon:yes stop_codon:yes gene_type:complete